MFCLEVTLVRANRRRVGRSGRFALGGGLELWQTIAALEGALGWLGPDTLQAVLHLFVLREGGGLDRGGLVLGAAVGGRVDKLEVLDLDDVLVLEAEVGGTATL